MLIVFCSGVLVCWIIARALGAVAIALSLPGLKERLVEAAGRKRLPTSVYDRPKPVRLRPSATAGFARPGLARGLKAYAGLLIMVFGVLMFIFPPLLDELTSAAIVYVIASVVFLVGLGITAPELRPATPSKGFYVEGVPGPISSVSDEKNGKAQDLLGQTIEIGVGRLGGIVLGMTLVFGYLLFERFTDPEISREELANHYCIFLANARCADVPDEIKIRRWQETPTITFARTPTIDHAATEDWEYTIESIVSEVLRPDDKRRGLVHAEAVPQKSVPHITVAFFNGSEWPEKESVQILQRANDGVIDRVQAELDLEALDREFEEIKPGSRASRQGLYGQIVLYSITSTILGIDTSWKPPREGAYIRETHVELRQVIYRIHHDPLLVAGIAFNDQREALNAILDKIYADPEGSLD